MIFYLTQFSLPVVTILFAIQDMYSTPIHIPYLCVLVHLIFLSEFIIDLELFSHKERGGKQSRQNDFPATSEQDQVEFKIQ